MSLKIPPQDSQYDIKDYLIFSTTSVAHPFNQSWSKLYYLHKCKSTWLCGPYECILQGSDNSEG